MLRILGSTNAFHGGMSRRTALRVGAVGGALSLPGVLRQDLLMRGQAREVTLTWQDLLDAKAAFVGNSLSGLIPIRLA